jgi:hypothetical protein
MRFAEEIAMSARLPDVVRHSAAISAFGSFRLTPSRELGGSLSVTVESRQILRVRRAIIRSGCPHVGIVRATPIAGTRVRLLIALDPEDLHTVMDAIMGEVSSGEFGAAARGRNLS